MITTDVLSAARRAAVGELLEATTAHDGVAALDEAARLSLDGDGDGAQHLLVARPDPADAEREHVIGYANLLADGTVQGMVDPGHRRHGHGSALLRAVLELRPDAGVWAHGALEGALTFLRGHGLRESRHLLTLRRPLGAEHPLPEVKASTLPGLELDTFRAERDADQWVAVNAEAFADHPEQGSMTRADLDRRLAEPWFDPEDLLLGLREGELIGFVWIKREDPAGDAEIYVVATSPSVQGHGVAGHLLHAALTRLQDAGAPGVELYVEADNAPALALYERWGFTTSGQDVQMHAAAEKG